MGGGLMTVEKMAAMKQNVLSAVLCATMIFFCVSTVAFLGYAFYKFDAEIREIKTTLEENERSLSMKDREITKIKAHIEEREKQSAEEDKEMLNIKDRISSLENLLSEKKNPVSTAADIFMRHVRKRRDLAGGETICLSFSQLLQLKGRDGKDGVDGRSGVDGKDGRDGRNGNDGQDGKDTTVGGTTYVRWGRTACGSNSSLLYDGFAAGSHSNGAGGGSTYICLPHNPEYGKTSDSNSYGWIDGAEYESGSFGIFPTGAHNQNVPCARCLATHRTAQMMIPAKRTCPESWTKEYDGYLMAEKIDHPRSAEYVCVDQSPEYITGEQANTNGALFYFQQTSCPALRHCPPYKQGAELTCVICTK